MKNILNLFVIIFSNVLTAQVEIADITNFYTDPPPSGILKKYYKDLNNNFDAFVGTWKGEVGNQTFIVTFWKVTQQGYPMDENVKYYVDEIRGHYKLVENYGMPNETLIYTSERNIGVSSTPWPCVIFAKSINEGFLSGHLFDVTQTNASDAMGVRGDLGVNLTTGSTATWSVTTPSDSSNQSGFTIPTDVSLIKIN